MGSVFSSKEWVSYIRLIVARILLLRAYIRRHRVAINGFVYGFCC